MNIKPVCFILGILLTVLAATMLLPAAIDFTENNPDWRVFLGSFLITVFTGVTLILTMRAEELKMDARQVFMLANLSWIVIAAFGALPFYFCELQMDYTDSFFESVSGITTTGSTVIVGLDHSPPGILFWRAILQWLGGVGILVMALSIMPVLQVGGMQLFKSEGLDMEKVMPSAAKISTSIGVVYVTLTFICAAFYALAGMSVFDAFAHSMTTIATGGYSTFDASIGHFDSATIETIAIVFMLLGSLPFVLYLHAIRGNVEPLFTDSQIRWFLGIILGVTAVMTLYLMIHKSMPFGTALRYGMFNFTSLITGTGYASTDYNQWGPFAVCMGFFFMCVGGCAGSTTCGIKVFRFQVLYAVSVVQLKKLINPHGMFEPTYNGKPMPKSVPIAVMSFFFMFAVTFTVLSILLHLIGLDFLTAMSGAATAIANVGPAFGDIIGPAGSFAPLPESAKWVLCAGMLLGRLELFTLLVMLHPNFWRY